MLDCQKEAAGKVAGSRPDSNHRSFSVILRLGCTASLNGYPQKATGVNDDTMDGEDEGMTTENASDTEDPAKRAGVATDKPGPPPPGSQAAVEMPDIAPPRTPTPLKPTWVVATIVVGVAADMALRRPPWNNLAFAILIAALAAGLLVSGFIRSKASQAMLAGSMVFGLLLAVRTETLLTLFNFGAALALLIGAAVVGRGRDMWNFGPARVIADGLNVFEKGIVTPVVVIQETGARYRQWDASESSVSKEAVRGLMIAAPIVLVLGILLASADVVFESFFTSIDLGGGTIFGHLLLAAFGAWAFIALLSLASKEDDPSEVNPSSRSLGSVETAIILGSITALFSVFAVAQLLTVVGGADDALTRAGLEPKEFARQGFFQLIWVALITVVIVMTVRVLTNADQRASLFARVGGYATVALTLLIVAVAVTRIFFYIDDDGMTPRRVYAFVVCLWIGISLLLLVLRLWGWKAEKSWLTAATAVVAVTILLGLNAINPQRLIANNHLERQSSNLIYHVEQNQFQGEGLAILIDGLDRFEPAVRDGSTAAICRYGIYDRIDGDDGDWLDFNWGRSQARSATDQLC